MWEIMKRMGVRTAKTTLATAAQGLRVGTKLLPYRRPGSTRVLIFAYHHVVDDIEKAEHQTDPGMVVSAESFQREMKLLQENYDVMPIDEAVAVLKGDSVPRKSVAVITFDDGYQDFYEVAWPILREMSLPATLYIPYAGVGSSHLLDHDRMFNMIKKVYSLNLSLSIPLKWAGLDRRMIEGLPTRLDPVDATHYLYNLPHTTIEKILRSLAEYIGEQEEMKPNGFSLLDWRVVEDLSRDGVTIGAHTINHPILPLEEEQTMAYEIFEGKSLIEEKLGRPIKHFAYPTGRYDESSRRMVAEAGFVSAVTTRARVNWPGSDLMTLGRICLSEESTRGIRGRYSDSIARLRLSI